MGVYQQVSTQGVQLSRIHDVTALIVQYCNVKTLDFIVHLFQVTYLNLYIVWTMLLASIPAKFVNNYKCMSQPVNPRVGRIEPDNPFHRFTFLSLVLQQVPLDMDLATTTLSSKSKWYDVCIHCLDSSNIKWSSPVSGSTWRWTGQRSTCL